MENMPHSSMEAFWVARNRGSFTSPGENTGWSGHCKASHTQREAGLYLQGLVGSEGDEIQAALSASLRGHLIPPGVSPLCPLSLSLFLPPLLLPIWVLTASSPLCPALAHHGLLQPHDSLYLPTARAQSSSSLR